MSTKKIENLKMIAEEISSAPSSEEQIALLSRGFELFSEETQRLDQAYGELREQFRAVNRKLEETNERLSNKVQELHVLTGYLDNILSRMAQGLLFIDSNGFITTYNQAAESILEKKRNEVLFQPFSEHFSDDLLGFSLTKALAEEIIPHTTFATLDFPDGREKEIEVHITVMPKNQEEPQALDFTHGFIVLIRDITEFRRLQILASRNDRMQALGEMAAQVAHEIRNPLGGIKGFASLLQRDLKDQPEQLKLTHYIVEGTNTLDRLVIQVLNYSRPLHLELKTADLKQIVDELRESLEAEGFIGKKVHFRLEWEKEIHLPVDKGLIKSALRNLFINAIQAMPEGGQLIVKLNTEENKAIIFIQDTGIGIPEEHLKKVFSPFFSTKADGNGLGLAEAHKVVQAHGGDITLSSIVGKGTEITIKLPIKV